MPCQPQFLKVTIDFFLGTGSTILAERLGLSTPSSPTSTPNSPTVLCSGVSGPLLSTCGSGPLCSSISGKSGGIPCCFSVASLHSLTCLPEGLENHNNQQNIIIPSAPLGRKGEPLQGLFSVCFMWKPLGCLDSNISLTLFIVKDPKGSSGFSAACVAL